VCGSRLYEIDIIIHNEKKKQTEMVGSYKTPVFG
jgi:hypothetical protein